MMALSTAVKSRMGTRDMAMAFRSGPMARDMRATGDGTRERAEAD